MLIKLKLSSSNIYETRMSAFPYKKYNDKKEWELFLASSENYTGIKLLDNCLLNKESEPRQWEGPLAWGNSTSQDHCHNCT